jgi:hypothetical protein
MPVRLIYFIQYTTKCCGIKGILGTYIHYLKHFLSKRVVFSAMPAASAFGADAKRFSIRFGVYISVKIGAENLGVCIAKSL